MLTYLNDLYYFKLRGTNGQSYRLAFGPGDVVLDPDTGIIVSLHIRFDDGTSQDLILLPAGQSQMQVQDFVADLLGEIGAQIAQSQIRFGNFLFDKLSEVIINHVKNEGVGILKRYFHQKGGAYYDVRTGLLMATNVLEKYDIEFK